MDDDLHYYYGHNEYFPEEGEEDNSEELAKFLSLKSERSKFGVAD